MTIWNATQVDLVAKSPNGEATLFMVEDRPWGEDPDQAEQLLAKVNTYCHYVVGGQLVSDFPDMAGLPVIVRLECPYQPTEEIQKVIDAAILGYGQYEIGMQVVVNPQLRSGS